MRVDPGQEMFVKWQQGMRDTGSMRPVPEELLKQLRTVSKDDRRRDESWNFAPVGVLSHVERDAINMHQLEAFARAFDVPLVKWPLQMVDEIENERLRRDLYADEPNLWGYFVQGAPIHLTETLKSVRKLVNGSPALMDSLSFRDDEIPEQLARAYARGGFEVVELDEAPRAVNVRIGGKQSPTGQVPGSAPGSVLWHGIELDDLSELITSVTSDAQVIPLLLSKNAEEVELTGLVAATANIAETVMVRLHQYQLAFALTDFKLQGRTLPKLILSICKRSKPPWMRLSCFYVLISRVRALEGLRLLQHDHEGLVAVSSLKHDEMLYAWEHGYGRGQWSDERAVAALKHIRAVRQRATQAGAAKRKAAVAAAAAKRKAMAAAVKKAVGAAKRKAAAR